MKPAGLLLAAVVASAVGSSAARQPPPLTDLLDTYFQGRYDDAVRKAAAIEDLGPLRLRVVQDVPVWVRADPARIEPRRAAAAAFLLELTHARLETDWGRLHDLVELLCVDLRSGSPAPSFELAWHRASVALASRARARLWLLGEYAQLPHQPPRARPPSKTPDPHPRHLVHALGRFPDDPQLRLAQIVAWTWGRDQEPIRNGEVRVFGPQAMLRRAPPQGEAIKALQPLLEDAVVGAEALVRAGLVHVSMSDPAAALQAFEQAQRRETNTPVRYLAFYSAGRVLDALNRPRDAMAQYVQALAVIPGAESATVALASLQFIHDDRERAVSLIRDTFAKPAAATDPGRLAGYGSFMHWPELLSAMRAELVK